MISKAGFFPLILFTFSIIDWSSAALSRFYEGNVCDGEAVSVNGANLSLSHFPNFFCQIVIGDIRIENIDFSSKPFLLPDYGHIREIQGSLIIKNTVNLFDYVKFDRLTSIVSKNRPALEISRNTNLKLFFGDNLSELQVWNRMKPTFVITRNLGIQPIDAGTYNILFSASQLNGFSLIDSSLDIAPNHTTFFKLLAGIFGFLVFIEGCAFVIITTFRRESLIVD